MTNNNQIFIRSKGKVSLPDDKPVLLKDLAEIAAEEEIKYKLENLNYPVDTKKEINVLISVISIISFIKEKIPYTDLVIIGQTDVLIHFTDKNISEDRYKILRLASVCFLLFIGAITAIINFHSDVDMKTAHSIIYEIITGEKSDRPLLLQIPYSLGIGAGMSVFFNHIFKKKLSTEPTPLEMEIYSYQQSVDEYIKNKTHGQQ